MMHHWKVEYTSFKGTRYANSNQYIFVTASSAISAARIANSKHHIPKSAINNITKWS